jgi:aminoglycoside phosphotransferase (APT) family kinase protein
MSPDEQELRGLHAAMLRMGLIAVGETPLLTQLSGGVSSRIVLVNTRRGSFCVKQALPRLKVAAEWLAPLERNQTEIRWLKVAARIAPRAVPKVLAEDRKSFAFAMEYLDPQSHPVWKGQLLAGEIDADFAAKVAALLVAMHAGTAGDRAISAAFDTDSAFRSLRLDPYLGATAMKHPDLAGALSRLIEVTSQQKRALVHGDVSPKNILACTAGPILLDAECAWYGDPAFDLAFCLNHLLLKALYRPQWAPALLRCYQVLAQTYLEGVGWESPTQLEQRGAALVMALLLARIDGKSPVEYLTSSRDRQRVRDFAKPGILRPPETLEAIRVAWIKEIAT